jgi:hypothetical protein
MARPALSTKGIASTLELNAALRVRSRTVLSVRVAEAPVVFETAEFHVRSPFPAAPLLVLMVTDVPAFRAAKMVALFATAGDTVGVKTLRLPPLKAPPLVAAVLTETSLAARETEREKLRRQARRMRDDVMKGKSA